MSEELILRLGFQYMGESQAKNFIANLTEAQRKAVAAAYGVDDLAKAIESGTLAQIEYNETAAKGDKALEALTKNTAAYTRAVRDAAKARNAWAAATKDDTVIVQDNTAATVENVDALKLQNEQLEKEVAALKAKTGATNAATVAQKKATEEEIKYVNKAQMHQNLADQVAFQRISSLKNLELAHQNYSKSYLRLNKMASSASPALERIATMGGIGLLGGAYEGVKMYASFNKVVTQSATQAGLNQKDIGYYQQGLLDISKKTGQSAQDLAEALYRVASGTAGWTGRTRKKILEVTRTVSDLTTLGNIKSGVQQEQAARVVTALINSGLKDVGRDPKKAAGLINAAVGSGDIKMSEMVSAMGRGTLLAAKAHGVSAADAMSWVDLLTSTGTTGSVAGTYVKSGLSQFLTPTAQGEKAYAMIGVNSATLQSLAANKGLGAAVAYFDQHIKSFNPFKNYPKTKGAMGQKGAINQLMMWTANQFPPELLAEWKNGFKGLKGKKLKDAQDEVFSLIATKAFGGSKGFTTMAAILENYQGFMNIRSAIGKGSSSDAYKRSVKLAESTPAAEFNKIKNIVVANLIEIGKTLTPFAISLGKFLASLTTFLTKFKPILESIVAIIGMAIVGVLKAKTAGLIMKAYPILGRELSSMDKFMNKIGMGEKWGKLGPEFRKQADLARMDKEEKLGKLYAKFGEDVVSFDENGVSRFVAAVDNFVTGGASGGRGAAGTVSGGGVGGSGAAGAAGAHVPGTVTPVNVKSAAQRLAEAEASKLGVLSGSERAFLERYRNEFSNDYIHEMGPITPKLLAREMGVNMRTKAGRQSVNDFYARLQGNLDQYGAPKRAVFGHIDNIASAENAARTQQLFNNFHDEKYLKFANRFAEGGDLAGQRLTKKLIVQELGLTGSKIDKMILGEVHSTLSQIMGSGNSLVPEAESALSARFGGTAGKAAEEEVAKRGLMSRMGGALSGGIGMLGGALDMLTGPVGMGIMAMLPVALPLISSAMHGLNSLFTSGTVVTPTTPAGYNGALNGAQLAARIAADKKKLTSLYVKLQQTGVGGAINEAKRADIISQINTLTTEIAADTGSSASLKTDSGAKTLVNQLVSQKTFLDKYGSNLLKTGKATNDTIGLYGVNFAPGLEHYRDGYAFAMTPEDFKKKYGADMPPEIYAAYKAQYYKSFKNGYQSETISGQKNVDTFVKWFQSYMTNYQNTTVSNLDAAGKVVDIVNPDFAASQRFRTQEANLSYWLNRSKDKNFGTKMNKATAENAFLSLQEQSGQAAYQAAIDRAYAANTSIPLATRQAYSIEADKMQSESIQLAAAATQLAQKKGLTAQDIAGLSTALSQAIHQTYQAYGIGATAKDIAAAFQVAITNSSAGLAAIVNRYNANLILR